MSDTKPTNPKDAIGATKLPTTVVPDVIYAYASLSFLEGAAKYGASNWSKAGVRVSIYLDAINRHLMKFKAGEWADPETGVPHLASVLAGVGIILDAHHRGMITDDRPPANPELVALIDAMKYDVVSIQELFHDRHPHQHTILDASPDKKGSGRLSGASIPQPRQDGVS